MRYTVLDLPPKGAGAFCPIPTTNYLASSFGLTVLRGSPGGTAFQAAPSPQAMKWCPSLTRGDGVNSAQPSSVSPDVMTRDIYIPYANNMGPGAPAGAAHIGMAIRRRNPMPVPALHYRIVPNVAFGRPRVGGRRVAPWPRAFQRWPARTVPGPGE